MLAVSLPSALFLLAVCSAAVALIGWLLSGSPAVVTRAAVRASARPAPGDDASGSGRPAPTPGATRAHQDP